MAKQGFELLQLDCTPRPCPLVPYPTPTPRNKDWTELPQRHSKCCWGFLLPFSARRVSLQPGSPSVSRKMVGMTRAGSPPRPFYFSPDVPFSPATTFLLPTTCQILGRGGDSTVPAGSEGLL